MTFFGFLRCLFGKHVRSQGKVREIDGLNYSACKYCKVPMRQDSSRRWHTDRRGRHAAEARARSANG